jgi:uncharacterized protein
MARYEMQNSEVATLGEGQVSADVFYDLGMKHSIGFEGPADFVSAHKWFNLAAMRGNKDAIRLRQEIATQMSEFEIAAAQRAARAWLTAH